MADGSLVRTSMRESLRTRVEPLALGLGRLGLSPDALTVIGFGVAVVAALASTVGLWFAAGVLVLFGGLFDMFDGLLARATGRTSRFGAFLDSTLDRAGEAVIYLGIAAGSSDFPVGVWLAAAAMGASFMVSYARAKSESLGFTSGTGMASVGLAPREVRIVILVVGLLFVGINGGIRESFLYLQGVELPFGLYFDQILGREWLQVSLGLIAILATITTIQRILFVRTQARAAESQS